MYMEKKFRTDPMMISQSKSAWKSDKIRDIGDTFYGGPMMSSLVYWFVRSSNYRIAAMVAILETKTRFIEKNFYGVP